jgi:hypothetical protein
MGSFNVALLEALLSAGVSRERARAVVDLFDKSIDERYGLHAQVLATKRDLAELNVALARDIAEVQAKLSATLAELDIRLTRELTELRGAVRSQIVETRADLIKWTLGALTAQTALLLGAIKLL